MSFSKFKSLHKSGNPLLLANVWDAHSAVIAQKAGAKAVGTSSHAISNAIGKEDGNNLTFDELLFFVKAVVKSVKIPVTVDIEAGYASDSKGIVKNIKALAKIGVVGVNIEDSEIVKGKRKLVDAELFAGKLKSITKALKGVDVFINLRTDTYVTKHKNAHEETIKRGKMYKDAGAHGLFVPLITKSAEIKKVINEVKLPLNVFALPDGPSYNEFTKAGVHRISSGDAAYAKIMKSLEDTYKGFVKKDLKSLF